MNVHYLPFTDAELAQLCSCLPPTAEMRPLVDRCLAARGSEDIGLYALLHPQLRTEVLACFQLPEALARLEQRVCALTDDQDYDAGLALLGYLEATLPEPAFVGSAEDPVALAVYQLAEVVPAATARALRRLLAGDWAHLAAFLQRFVQRQAHTPAEFRAPGGVLALAHAALAAVAGPLRDDEECPDGSVRFEHGSMPPTHAVWIADETTTPTGLRRVNAQLVQPGRAARRDDKGSPGERLGVRSVAPNSAPVPPGYSLLWAGSRFHVSKVSQQDRQQGYLPFCVSTGERGATSSLFETRSDAQRVAVRANKADLVNLPDAVARAERELGVRR